MAGFIDFIDRATMVTRETMRVQSSIISAAQEANKSPPPFPSKRIRGEYLGEFDRVQNGGGPLLRANQFRECGRIIVKRGCNEVLKIRAWTAWIMMSIDDDFKKYHSEDLELLDNFLHAEAGEHYVRMRFEDPDDNRALRIVRTFIEKKNPKVDGGREAKTIERTVPGEDVDSLQEQDSSSGNNPETVYPNNHSRLHWTRIRASYRKIAAKLSSNDDISYRY